MERACRTIQGAALPPALRGTWAAFQLPLAPLDPRTRVALAFTDVEGAAIPGGRRLRHVPGGVAGLGFVPEGAVAVAVEAVGWLGAARPGDLAIRALPRWRAAVGLLRESPRRLAGVLAPPFAPRDVVRRFRNALVAPPPGTGDSDVDYADWAFLFDTWNAEDLPPEPGEPSVGLLLLADAADRDALPAAASLPRLFAPAPGAVAPPDDWREAVGTLGTDYVGLLGPDDLLPPWAVARARRELARAGRPPLAIADADSLDAAGGRRDPEFRPRPNRALMLSGTLATGLWLVRREVLLRHGADAASAEAFRLALWFAFHEATGEDGVRIPYVLSHRAEGRDPAPEPLAGVAAAHAARTGLPFAVEAATPLRLTLLRDPAVPPITAIVPSTLRPAHALRCVTAILRGTDHPDFRVEVAVSQPHPLDDAQRRAADAIAAHPNAAVSWLDAPRFNFSWVNNRVAERLVGRDVLLLNDDVSPIAPDWLRRMAAWLADPRVGAVGARLLYPTGRVQHGGILMGVTGICEHAHRGIPGDAPGYAHRAVLAGEMSAVTGACLLVRRAAYAAVGGLDEDYPSAFNDVDLCLRLGEAGYRVIYEGGAALHHHELQTYGSHYGGERAAFQMTEGARMRARWSRIIADDPFHDPNLSLDFGREWQLAFPPRTPG